MSVRVERIGAATLILGRCEDVLQDARADLLLTDPPYGIRLDTDNAARNRGGRPYAPTGRATSFPPVAGDDRSFDPAPLLTFRNAVIWGANNFADRLPASPCWFAWDRKAGKAADSDITDCELAWVRGLPYKTVRLFRHMWAGFQRDSESGHTHLHPTQKPVALMEWCLSFFPESRTVFDPYMGSGPVGLACARKKINYIGVECDEMYFETACRRLREFHGQVGMFAPPAADPQDARVVELFAEPGVA